MDTRLAQLLDDLYARGREHDERQADRLDRLRNVEPDTARLLAVLIRALAPKRMLELGKSNGYSTIWLADAARTVGGSLTSVEIDPARAVQARENLRAAGVEEFVDVRVEDAGAVLAAGADGEWDFIFLDAVGPPTPATGPILCASWPHGACWRWTTSSPTRTRWRSSASLSPTTTASARRWLQPGRERY